MPHASISNDGYSRITEVEAYQSMQSTATTGKVQWLVTDHLGTPRMIADLSGSLSGITRHDYLPFGEELGGGIGGRTSARGYAADDVRQQFTGYERDDETQLDYAQARYYGAMSGRFISPDPYNVVFETQAMAESDPEKAQTQFLSYLTQPQQWNRYVYVANNPLKYVDPTGEELWLTGTEEERKKALEHIKGLVGSDAAKYLSTSEKCTNSGIVTVVSYDRSRDALASKADELGVFISNIIDSKKVTEYKIAEEFNTKDGHFTTARFGGAATVGAEESLNGHTQIFVNPNAADIAQQKFGSTLLGHMSSNNGQTLDFYADIVDAHEFGHAYANAIEGIPLKGSNGSNSRALQLENYARARRGLSNRRRNH